MWHDGVGGIAARNLNAEITRFCSKLFFTAITGRAFAAADRGIGDAGIANLDVLDVGADSDNFAFDFVAEREGELAARAHVKLVATAHVKMTVMDMHIGMADATMRDFEKHFGALRGGCFALDKL
jgi:hypothetical protein